MTQCAIAAAATATAAATAATAVTLEYHQHSSHSYTGNLLLSPSCTYMGNLLLSPIQVLLSPSCRACTHSRAGTWSHTVLYCGLHIKPLLCAFKSCPWPCPSRRPQAAGPQPPLIPITDHLQRPAGPPRQRKQPPGPHKLPGRHRALKLPGCHRASHPGACPDTPAPPPRPHQQPGRHQAGTAVRTPHTPCYRPRCTPTPRHYCFRCRCAARRRCRRC